VSVGLAYGGDALWYFQMVTQFIYSIPYVYVWFDYPPLAAYFFTLIYALTSSNLQWFAMTLRFFQLPLELATTLIIYRIIKQFCGGEGHAFLAALAYNLSPVVLFSWTSRFDCIPTFLVMLSVYMLFKERFITSFFLLAVGTLFKWFPAVLVPLWLAYSLGRVRWKGFFTFTGFCIAVAAPFLLLAPQKFIESAYLYHALREPNYLSLSAAIQFFLCRRLSEMPSIVSFASLTLQLIFCLAPIIIFPRSKDGLCAGCAFTLLGVVAFAGFFSPQWITWMSPLLLVNVRQRRSGWIIYWVLQSVTYLQYPVLNEYHHVHLTWPRHWWRSYVYYSLTAIRSLALFLGMALIGFSFRTSIITSLKRGKRSRLYEQLIGKLHILSKS
jgi:hypothetical protein